MSRLHVSPDLSLPADAVATTFALLAVRRAGKSNAAAVMAEALFKAKLPFVVIDPKGDWYGLRSSADGTGPGLSIPIFGGEHADVPLERGGGAFLADLIVDQRLPCILDVSEFSEGDKVRFLIDFAERLYRRNREALHVFLEEADDYIPQRPFREQARCVGAFQRLVKRGGFRGIGVTLISQRSAAVNKDVLTQTETLIVLRTTSPQDRDAIGRWLEYHGESDEILASLPTLEDGEAWVLSPHVLRLAKPVRIRFHRRATFDSGATPKASAQRRDPATLADVDLGAIESRMKATIEKAKAEDPAHLRRRIAELERQLREKPAPPAPKETRVEVPALKDSQLTRLIAHYERMLAEAEKHGQAMSLLWQHQAEEAKTLLGALQAVAGLKRAPAPVVPIRPDQARPEPRVHGVTPRVKSASPNSLPAGEHRVLTAIAQHGDAGVTREQLTILAGYRKSTRDLYVQRLRTGGHVDAQGDRLVATDAGVAALGAGFVPLPTGDALRAYWLQRLPEGERRLLQVLVDATPNAVDREAISEAAGYRKSTRDLYLQRLGARRLVVPEGRGAVRAAAELFG